MNKISVIGGGNVGAGAAFFIAEKCIADVGLFDIREGLAAGKALDMMEAAPLRRYRSKITALSRIEEVAGAEAVVIAANQPLRPGMSARAMVAGNVALVRGLGEALRRLAPESVILVATEPVDVLTAFLVRSFGFKRTRVLGVGGILDAGRLKYHISQALRLSLENVAALVLGAHDEEMVIEPAFLRVSGAPLVELMSEAEIGRITETVRTEGRFIVEMAEKSRSYYSPSAAVAELVEAVHLDLNRVFPVSVLLDGEYGIKDAALSLPCVIGARGAERILTPSLSAGPIERLKSSAARLRAALEDCA